MILNKIWSFGDKNQKIDVIEIDSKTMRFRIANPKVRERILKRGMWNIADVPLVVSKWTPIREEADPEDVSIPLWVHLTKVPMNMFSWQGLSFISSAVGGPVKLHPETAACTTFDVAKVFVNAELAKGFPKSINFTIEGKVHCVDFTYPWLPSRCEKCGRWGHIESNCGAKEKQKEIEKSSKKKDTVKKDSPSKLKEMQEVVVVEPKSPEVEKTNDISANVMNEGHENCEPETELEEGQMENVWLTPGKTGRSSNKQKQNLKYGEVQIFSQSRFSALSVPEEDVQELGNHVEKEGKTEGIKEGGEEVDEASEAEILEEKQQTVDLPPRQILHRASKTNHRVIPEVAAPTVKDTNPNTRSRKGTRNNQ